MTSCKPDDPECARCRSEAKADAVAMVRVALTGDFCARSMMQSLDHPRLTASILSACVAGLIEHTRDAHGLDPDGLLNEWLLLVPGDAREG